MKTKNNSLTSLALQKFKKNTTGVLSFWFVVICGVIAVFAYFFAPDNSSNANQMHLEIHSKEPGFSVLMLTLPLDENKSQSFFNNLFFGHTQNNTEVPIKSYLIKNNLLEYVSLGDGLAKSISSKVVVTNPERYIKKKKRLRYRG